MCMGGWRMNLKERLAGIDANLDDLQAGLEAFSRKAAALNSTAVSALAGRAAELKASASDQRGVLQDLRDAIARLQKELTRSNGAVRPPPQQSIAADRFR
jgi:chromosome segregation ATPase